MVNRTGVLLALLLALPSGLQAEAPLSAIDWLNNPDSSDYTGPVLLEPPVSSSARKPEIRVTPLDSGGKPVGLVPGSVTGLPANLWAGSEVEQLTTLIRTARIRDFPALQSLFFTLLLAETNPPPGEEDAERLLLARLDRLIDLGAVDPARELVKAAGPGRNAARFARWFDASLLTGDEDRSCALLMEKPHLAPSFAARIFCTARTGDWAAAALMLDSARALDLLPGRELALLDRFIDAELSEDAPALPPPDTPDPLTFRLYETIGERLPTTDLPRAFATADLRDVAGWKAQIEAAERLVRSGALAPNQLLGFYTARAPAASGGVWERVAAVQRFETALDSGSTSAIGKTLPPVWAAMQESGLEVPFATLLSDRLAELDLKPGAAQDLLWRIRLLGPGYEAAAQAPHRQSAENDFLSALARGRPGDAQAPTPLAEAVAKGFATDARPADDLQEALAGGRLGEVILRTIVLFDTGAEGNLPELTGALATLRRVGLEDTARRAALQIMLLERRT